MFTIATARTAGPEMAHEVVSRPTAPAVTGQGRSVRRASVPPPVTSPRSPTLHGQSSRRTCDEALFQTPGLVDLLNRLAMDHPGAPCQPDATPT